uniref:Genome polyprotein n=1 Tax=Jiahe virus TaxID=3141827 RepID=A0AAU6SJ89_9VIRU
MISFREYRALNKQTITKSVVMKTPGPNEFDILIRDKEVVFIKTAPIVKKVLDDKKFKIAKINYKKLYSLEYYNSLLRSFSENKYKFVNKYHYLDFVKCVSYNAKEIKRTDMFDYLNYCGRWPCKQYGILFEQRKAKMIKAFDHNNRIMCALAAKNANIYSYLRVYTTYGREEEEEDFDQPSTSTGKPVRPRRRSFDDLTDVKSQSDLDNFYIKRTIEAVKTRSVMLITKLRCMIRRLRNPYGEVEYPARVVYNRLEEAVEMQPLIQPEMEEPTSVDKSGNTAIITQHGQSTETVTAAPASDFWVDRSIGDKIHKTEEERWIYLEKFSWSKDDEAKKNIYKAKLPLDVLKNRASDPAAMHFYQYALWKGDMEVKLHINSNAFYVGKLMMSWYQMGDYDVNLSSRYNLASYVLEPNVSVLAHVSNEATLTIPYISYRSMLSLRKRTNDDNSFYLGNLRISVFNELRVKSGMNDSIDCIVYVRFLNNNFACPMPRLVKMEMMLAKKVLEASERVVHQVNTVVKNLDNPPDVQAVQNTVIRPTDSWSTGNLDVQLIEHMRLTPSQTPHPSGSSVPEDEMSFAFVKRRWGYLSTGQWSKDDTNDKKLWSLSTSPILSDDQYPNVKCEVDGSEFKAFVLPPISILAHMHAYWRGSIEYKFEFINSPHQLGSVMIAYIPRDTSIELKIENMRQCYHVLFDLGSENEFIFKVPFISDRPWFPRYNDYVGSEVYKLDSPGVLVMVVLNKLAIMNNVADTVDFNVYIRGGEDFEVAVPCAPSVAPLIDGTFYDPIWRQVKPKDGYMTTQIGTGTWRYLQPNTAIVRYGAAQDHVMQFTSMNSFTIYTVATGIKNNILQLEVKQTTRTVKCKYFCRVIVNGDRDTYNYMAPFDSEAAAEKYIKAWQAQSKDPFGDSPLDKLIPCSEDLYFNLTPKQNQFILVAVATISIQPEILEVDVSSRRLATTIDGRDTFGESFNNLKALGSRFQLYSHFEMALKNVDKNAKRLAVHCTIPILPIGLIPDGDVATTRYTREGIIPFIASMYRFYRGGLRFKFVVVSKENVNLVIQHRPDAIIKARAIKLPISVKKPDDVIQSGYAMTMISTIVNNMATIEVPCYIPSQLLLSQRPDFDQKSESLHYGMGEFALSLVGDNMTGYAEVYVYYSLADDAKFSSFIGAPPSTNLKPTSAVDLISDAIRDIQPEMNNSVVKAPGLFGKMKNKITDYTKNVATKIVVDHAGLETADGIFSTLELVLSKICDEHGDAIRDSLFHLMHCLANPNPLTYGIAIVAILCKLGFVMNPIRSLFLGIIGGIFDKLKKAFKWVRGEADVPNESDEGEDPFHEEKKGLLTVVLQSVCATLKYPFTAISNIKIPDFTKGLWLNLKSMGATFNTLFTMAKNIIFMFKKVYYWVASKFGHKFSFDNALCEGKDLISKWIDDCEALLDPNNKEQLCESRELLSLLDICVIIGRDLQTKMTMNEGSTFKNAFYVSRLYNRILKLRDEMLTNTLANAVRFEPFCIAQHGPSQIGKTFITNAVSTACLKAIDFKTNGQLIYTRTPGNQYWNGLRNQPICVYDDFLQIQESPACYQDIGELITLKSAAVFNPPQAELENKHIKYNPLIVFLNQNRPYPRIPGLADQAAWMNRRDILVHVQMIPKHRGRLAKDLNKEEVAGFRHLRFSVHKSRSNENEGYDLEDLTYAEYLEFVIEKFKNYYRREQANYLARFKELADFSPEVDFSLSDNVEYYMQTLSAKDENSFTARQTRELAEIQQGLARGVCPKCEMILCICKSNIMKGDQIEPQMYGLPQLCEHHREPEFWDPIDKKYYDDEDYEVPVACTDPDCNWKFDELQWAIKRFGVPMTYHARKMLMPKHIACAMNEEQKPKEIKNRADEFKLSLSEYATPEKKVEVQKKLFGSELAYKTWCLIKSLGKVMLILGSFYAGWKLFNKAKEYYFSEPTVRQHDIKDLTTAPIKQMAYNNPKHAAIKTVKTTAKRVETDTSVKAVDDAIVGQMSDSMRKSFVNILCRNTLFIQAHQTDGTVTEVRCLGIKDDQFILVDHYLHAFESYSATTEFYFIVNSAKFRVYYQDLKFKKLENSALMIGYAPLHIPRFRNITKYFITEKHAQAMSRACTLYMVDIDIDKTGGMRYTVRETKDYVESIVDHVVVPGLHNNASTYIDRCYSYNTSGKGLCGSVLLADNIVGCPIMGIHVAGNVAGGVGYSEAIVRETFENIPSLTQDIDIEGQMLPSGRIPILPVSNAKAFLTGMVEHIGCVPTQYSHRPPEKSKQIKSECFDKITHSTYDTPILTKKDPRCGDLSPMVSGCSHHGDVPIPFPQDKVDKVYNSLLDQLKAKCVPIRRPQILTIEQAIDGIEGMPEYGALEFSTAEGFPYTAFRPADAKDKRWLFNREELDGYWKTKSIDQTLAFVMNYKQKQREQGIIPFTVFTDCLKDMKLPREKPQARIISVSPVDYTIHFRQYNYDFMVAYQKSRFAVESAIGINVDSTEWTDMVHQLNNFAPNYACGDYSKFGPRLQSACALKTFINIAEWYKYHGDDDPINFLVRVILGFENTFAIHMMLNYLYRVYTGGPSGGPLTTILNNEVNKGYIRIVYLIRADRIVSDSLVNPLGIIYTLVEFKNNIKIIYYGDDLIGVIKDGHVHIFNMKVIQSILSEFHIKFTDATKSQDSLMCLMNVFDPEVTFLKRRIVRHPFRKLMYMAAMDRRALEETCNWVNTDIHIREMSINACVAMLQNAHGQGKAYYTDLANRVKSFWHKRQVDITLLEWEDLDNRVYTASGLAFESNSLLANINN